MLKNVCVYAPLCMMMMMMMYISARICVEKEGEEEKKKKFFRSNIKVYNSIIFQLPLALLPPQTTPMSERVSV